jgi:hypothetical protein
MTQLEERIKEQKREEPPRATPEEVDEAIYDTITPERARRILDLPTHMKRTAFQGIKIPLVDAFSEVMGSPALPNETEKARALEATIAGYTPEDMKALVQHKLSTRPATAPTYCIKWALDDLAGFKAKAQHTTPSGTAHISPPPPPYKLVPVDIEPPAQAEPLPPEEIEKNKRMVAEARRRLLESDKAS